MSKKVYLIIDYHVSLITPMLIKNYVPKKRVKYERYKLRYKLHEEEKN